jgi:hypothetical protein
LELALHHAEHGSDFGASTPAEYEQMADAFWSNPKPSHIFQCTRTHGDVLRFDTMTETFCVLSSAMVIRTFYKPVPCSSLPPALAATMAMSGDCHTEATNLVYFQRECRK